MIDAYGLYIASAVGAAALFMMMPRRGFNPRALGALLGAATLGGLWLWLSDTLFDQPELGLSLDAMPYYYIFSAVAIIAAVRVITHTQPVYSALWFVMVVLASAGLFIVLGAEFVAFGMVIIYGGAILVTYMFVIMLASQSEEAEDAAKSGGDDVLEYERVAREPAAAVLIGFALLAMLLDVSFRQMEPNPAAVGPTVAALTEGTADNPPVFADRTSKSLIDNVENEADRDALKAVVNESDGVSNVERVGVDMFRGHPLGLELAGVILLISLIGAIVIAKQRGTIPPVVLSGTGEAGADGSEGGHA